jgi:RNA polymerase-interacting CarD/CdnL/TRCF family regulator
MLIKKKLRIGNKLIEGGKVYKIFKISFEDSNGKRERTIHYRPHYQGTNTDTLVCSIPECNMEHTDIRIPIKKSEMGQLLKYLSKRSNKKWEVDVVNAKTILNLNDVHETARVAKVFWREKMKKDVNFTKTKKDVLESAIDRMVEEVALVIGISVNTAKEKITIALQRYPN